MRCLKRAGESRSRYRSDFMRLELVDGKSYNNFTMRLLSVCVGVAIASAALPQSTQEFHNRYGEPDLERFEARPGISLTVEYGSDYLACQITMEPPQPLVPGEERIQFMSSEGVSELLEEVVPVAMRGNVISRSSFQSSCGVGYFTDYENISIMRGMSACRYSSPEHDSKTQIIFKRDVCPKIKNPLGVTAGSSH